MGALEVRVSLGYHFKHAEKWEGWCKAPDCLPGLLFPPLPCTLTLFPFDFSFIFETVSQVTVTVQPGMAWTKPSSPEPGIRAHAARLSSALPFYLHLRMSCKYGATPTPNPISPGLHYMCMCVHTSTDTFTCVHSHTALKLRSSQHHNCPHMGLLTFVWSRVT